MSTPAPNPNKSTEFETIQDIDMNQSIRERLPHKTSTLPPAETPPNPPVSEPDPTPQPVESKPPRWRFKFLPAFWTIASLLSITVNIVLIVLLLMTWQLLGSIQGLATGKTTTLLGGLYTNFVKMDQARITRTVPVKADIPLNIVVPVQATTSITLAERAVISNAHVVINTASMSINAPAQVTLPAGTPLMVTLDFPLTVQNTIPVELKVPVDIPLNETQLHEPFVGLQQVVKPWYCFVQPGAMQDGRAVCTSNRTASPAGQGTP